MVIPQPVVGISWLLTIVILSLSIWVYSGLVAGMAFLGGAIAVSFFWLMKEQRYLKRDRDNKRRAGVILLMTSVAVVVWIIAAPGFGLFFGGSAIFGYLVGLICSRYMGSDGNNNQ